MPKTQTVITARTDAEWPADHPLRQVAGVMANQRIAEVGKYLICTLAGEPRLPPAPDDHDVTGVCCVCSAGIMYRASAPAGLETICWKCWHRNEGHST